MKSLLALLLIGVFARFATATKPNYKCKTTHLGKEYRGMVMHARGGYQCQRWDSQSPHKHTRTPELYKDAGLISSFCRNPDGEPDGPWCYTTSTKKRWAYCNIAPCAIELCATSFLGSEYRGEISETRDGLQCQRWDSQSPHEHIRTADNYIHAGLFENYCRNPDGEPEGPWCYTTSKEKRWDYCNVPVCINDGVIVRWPKK